MNKQIISVKDLVSRYGVTRMTINNWVKAGKFPSGFKLGHRFRRWTLQEIERFEQQEARHAE